jgi:hypothetical protein
MDAGSTCSPAAGLWLGYVRCTDLYGWFAMNRHEGHRLSCFLAALRSECLVILPRSPKATAHKQGWVSSISIGSNKPSLGRTKRER